MGTYIVAWLQHVSTLRRLTVCLTQLERQLLVAVYVRLIGHRHPFGNIEQYVIWRDPLSDLGPSASICKPCRASNTWPVGCIGNAYPQGRSLTATYRLAATSSIGTMTALCPVGPLPWALAVFVMIIFVLLYTLYLFVYFCTNHICSYLCLFGCFLFS